MSAIGHTLGREVLPLPQLGLADGQQYRFLDRRPGTLWRYLGVLGDGQVRFLEEVDEEFRSLDQLTFAEMRGNGNAVLDLAASKGGKAKAARDIPPDALWEGDAELLDGVARKARRAARAKLKRAMTIRAYVVRLDEEPWTSRTERGLDAFMRRHQPEVEKEGYEWTSTRKGYAGRWPSPSTLRKAWNDCGLPGDRPLTAFQDRAVVEGKGKWPSSVVLRKQAMLDYYWSKEAPRKKDAIAFFKAPFSEMKKGRRKVNISDLPNDETLRQWINAAASKENYEKRTNAKMANARYVAVGTSVQATKPLERVLIDHTRVDVWAKVVDAYGRTVLVERPWLAVAVDMCSRSLVGACLTFEPPSLNSVMEVLRSCLDRKRDLVEQYGHCKGATDVWGRPKRVVVDNAWETTGKSFQVACESAGINVSWAKVKDPKYKAHVERLFGTLNSKLWHCLPGAIPFKGHEIAELELDPPAEAEMTIEDLASRFWDVVLTDYSLEPHDGIDMAPAEAWSLGIKRYGRHMVANALDLQKYFGRVEKALLTTSGVTYNGERFTDRDAVTRLLDRLLGQAPVRRQRKSTLSSGTVEVQILVPDWSVDFIDVWDSVERTTVRLYNVKDTFKGLSWFHVKLIRAHVKRHNLAFHSEEEKVAARNACLSRFGSRMPGAPATEKRRRARVLVPFKPQIVDGGVVTETLATPTVSGLGRNEVPVLVPAVAREGEISVRTGPRRGGSSATRKAVETRKANAGKSTKDRSAGSAGEGHIDSPVAQDAGIAPLPAPSRDEEDSAAFLAALANDLAWRH